MLGGSHAFRLARPGSGPRSGPAQPVHFREALPRLAFLKDTAIPKPATITISSHPPMNHPTPTPPADGNATARVVGDVDDVARHTLLPVNPAGLLMVEPLPRARVRASEAMQKQFATPDDSFRQNPNILEFEQLFDALWYPYIINPFREDRDDSPLHRQPLHSRSSSTVLMGRRKHSPIRRVHDEYRNRHRGTLRLRDCEPGTNARKIDSKHFRKYKSKLKAFLENKLNRLQEGKLTPGSEVTPVKRARRDARIFELRWHHETTIHRSAKTQIRHYVGEPPEIEDTVFGLVIHLKDISGTETEITEKQNEQIDKSLNLYSKHSANGWKLN